MATSNLVKAIGRLLVHLLLGCLQLNFVPISDTAFVDRADIIQYVDLPPREAIYDILRSSLCEMAVKGVVAPIVCHPPFWSNINDSVSEYSNAEAGSDI
jgi:hypothetical protein